MCQVTVNRIVKIVAYPTAYRDQVSFCDPTETNVIVFPVSAYGKPLATPFKWQDGCLLRNPKLNRAIVRAMFVA